MLTRVFPFVLAIVSAISVVSAVAACNPIPGAELVWSKADVRWVFVGEMHGTNEAPAGLLDLVCDALAHGRRVTVALERPASEQQALEAILSTSDLAAVQKALLQQPGWRHGDGRIKEVLDGRASEAMLRLLLALRELRRTYPDLAVAAFDAPYTRNGLGARDEALGHALLALGTAKSRHMVLILTGNLHAMQAPLHGYDFAAMFLPAPERLSLEVTDRGGEAWAWSSDLGICGPLQGGVGDKGITRPRGIYLDPTLAPYGMVDGVLSLGVALTASAPAAGEPSPLPDCRIKYLAEHPTSPSRR